MQATEDQISLFFYCTFTGTAQLSVSRSLKECCWISIFSWCMEPKTQRGRLSTLIIWRLHLTRKRYCGTFTPWEVTFMVLLWFLTNKFNPHHRASAQKGSQRRMTGLQAWTRGVLTHSHWRGSRWTSLKSTIVQSAASPPRTSQRSTSTFLSTSLTARPISVRSVACATPRTAHWPDTSLSCIGWRSHRASSGTTDGAKTTTRVRERTSWMLQMRTTTGRQIPNAKFVGRILKRRETWTLTWGHMGWRS